MRSPLCNALCAPAILACRSLNSSMISGSMFFCSKGRGVSRKPQTCQIPRYKHEAASHSCVRSGRSEAEAEGRRTIIEGVSKTSTPATSISIIIGFLNIARTLKLSRGMK